MNDDVKMTKDWLETEFYKSNIKKYHKYCQTWLNNLTNEQLYGFEKQRIGMITNSKIKTNY